MIIHTGAHTIWAHACQCVKLKLGIGRITITEEILHITITTNVKRSHHCASVIVALVHIDLTDFFFFLKRRRVIVLKCKFQPGPLPNSPRANVLDIWYFQLWLLNERQTDDFFLPPLHTPSNAVSGGTTPVSYTAKQIYLRLSLASISLSLSLSVHMCILRAAYYHLIFLSSLCGLM